MTKFLRTQALPLLAATLLVATATYGTFVSKKAEIDAMLTRLQALSGDHFNYSLDEID